MSISYYEMSSTRSQHMLRYYAAATALKLFGLNSATRKAYRGMGNATWAVRKPKPPVGQIRAACRLLTCMRNNGLLDRRPLRAVEIGTGWMHFYAIIVALVAREARIDLYDVWDNRQFRRMKRTFALVSGCLGDLDLTAEEVSRATDRFETVASARNFDDLYRAFGMRYFDDAGGELAPLASAEYDVAFSLDVLEHIANRSVVNSVNNICRILKPGGVSLHEVGLEDHLSQYDRDAAPKQFLAYSERHFQRWLDNEVQHINLVSADEWRRLFLGAGFEELEFAPMWRKEHLPRRAVHHRFEQQSPESLMATRLAIVHRKPA